MTAARRALEEPWVHSVDDPALIEMGRSDPNSDSWDTVLAVDKFLQGARDAHRPSDPK
ncbi:MAG TPA: hypothetical protein VNT75_17660 [Symbiobacteriaceae bacterium]|nr:hypothetical protein [Symbiobacteriaceae bacterium]